MAKTDVSDVLPLYQRPAGNAEKPEALFVLGVLPTAQVTVLVFHPVVVAKAFA